MRDTTLYQMPQSTASDPVTAPTSELGYVVPFPGNFWALDDDTTPELRWPNAVKVFRSMRRQDAQITSIYGAITLPVQRTGWRIDPNGAPDEVVEHISQDLGLPIVGVDPDPKAPKPRTRGRFSWAEHVRLALLHLQYGHMPFEQLYRIDDKGYARLGKLSPRMPASISNWDVARDGGLVSIRQFASSAPVGPITEVSVANVPIPVDRLVVYVNDKEGGDWLGNSILRPGYKNWLLKDRLLRVAAQTIERNGMGIPTYTAGSAEENLKIGREIAMRMRAGDSSGIALPHDAKMELLGVKGQLPDALPWVRYHDEQMARSVLAHFLNLGTQTGSWALGSTFADFFVMTLQTKAQHIADIANAHIVEDIVDINYGETVPAPRIVPDEIGSRHDATAAALSLLVGAGLIRPDQVLDSALRTQYGLPAADPDAPEPPPPAPAAPPAPDDQDPDEPDDSPEMPTASARGRLVHASSKRPRRRLVDSQGVLF